MSSAAPVRSLERRNAVVVIALTSLGLVLRVIFLSHKGLWQDEVFSVLFARPSNADFWPILKTAEANMALYYLLLRQWVRLFTSDAGIRMLSVIPGVFTVPAIYALGRRLYSQPVATWAAVLLTVNACAVVYSQEARGYSMLVLFATLSCWAFLRLIEQSSPLNLALYIAFSVCAFYSHFYAVFVFLAQALVLALLPATKIPWKSLLLSWVLIAFATVPGLRVVMLSHGSNLWWLPRPGLLELYRIVAFLAAESGKAVGGVLAALFLVPIGVALAQFWNTFRANGCSLLSFYSGFAAFGLLIPILATVVLSFWRPLFFHRFLIICLVPFLLLAASGLQHLKKHRTLLASAILLLSCVATGISYTKVREDWRGAAALTLGPRASAPVVFYLKDAAAPFAYYRERLGSPMTEAQAIRMQSPPTAADVTAWAQRYPELWVVRFPLANHDLIDIRMADTLMQEYSLCERRDFKGMSVSWFMKGDCPPLQ